LATFEFLPPRDQRGGARTGGRPLRGRRHGRGISSPVRVDADAVRMPSPGGALIVSQTASRSVRF
jgi:hypothetical protein